jgi:hypothetical protein
MTHDDNTPNDLADALRLLVKDWESRVNAARLRADRAGAADVHQMYYQQGQAEAYKKAADAVRLLLGESEELTETHPAPAQVTYELVPGKEVQAILARAGLNVRTLYSHSDNAFSAIFPRLHPMSHDERLQALAGADPRIVVLESGKMPDSGEFYIDFAFAPPQ